MTVNVWEGPDSLPHSGVGIFFITITFRMAHIGEILVRFYGATIQTEYVQSFRQVFQQNALSHLEIDDDDDFLT
jgi:hypothetical protein